MNQTERFIKKFYRSINVEEPLQLSLYYIIDMLGIKLIFWPHTSAIAVNKNKHVVFINEFIPAQQQWQEFGHEMYHYFFDVTRYDMLHENYGAYGETKADYFSYHFCVPTFMLDTLSKISVYKIMNLFNVEYDFACKRLDMYKSKYLHKMQLANSKII